MDITRAVNELYIFASEPRAFRFDELLSLVDANIDSKALRIALLSKSRFICLQAESQYEDQFMLDSALFQWLCRLNLKLAQIKRFRLTERQLTSTLNLLRKDGRWDFVPGDIIHWGQSLGLICRAYTKGHFVFPLARVLAYMKKSLITIVADVLTDFYEEKIWNLPLKKRTKAYLKEGFSNFNENISYVVQCREGLLKGRRRTLQEIGNYYNLTRERVRQVEEKFWFSLHYGFCRIRPFIKAFLSDFISESGSLVVGVNSYKAPRRRFLAKCVGIPQLELLEIGLVSLATFPKEMAPLKSSRWFPQDLDSDIIANRLESKGQISLSAKDVKIISKKMSQLRLSHLSKLQRTYVAMRTIGRPAHFSEITSVYNSLWPDYASAEHNIHAALSFQRHGIVWIGIKGTYALKEWGYERPSMTLFDTISEIVQNKHDEMGVPVPIRIITAELGKYRRIVKPSSITLATYTNPRLKRVGKDTFVPRCPDEEAKEEIALDELNKIFKDFQKKSKY